MLKGAFVESKNLNPCLDVELLEDYLARMGKKVVEQMFTLYCQQVEIYLNDIKQAQLSNSLLAWQESCHKMKGAAASVGLVQLHGKLKELEKIKAEQQEKSVLLSELVILSEQATCAFKDWLAKT